MNMSISTNYARLREEIPKDVTIVLSVKTRTVEQIEEAIDAGVTDIGQNYVQEAGQMYSALKKKATKVRWHMIGHLQTNKINKALRIFDVIQTIDSLEKAAAIDKRAERARKEIVPVSMSSVIFHFLKIAPIIRHTALLSSPFPAFPRVLLT
ncbi:unnamed protein product, partial [marine sediment metagenome]